MIAEVAFNLPLERTFHYSIPSAMSADAHQGVRVLVPFGPRERMGTIVRLVEKSPFKELKSIRRVVDPMPVIAEERWALAEWMARYYFCSLGEALSAMVPSTLRFRSLTPEPPSAPAQPLETPRSLSAPQQQALHTILASLEAPSPKPILLYGVTGSGKTELYLHAITRVLQQNRSAICLVPEIALTPQTIERFVARFGAQVCVWHSRMTTSRRAIAWMRLAQGVCRVVVGTRSAVFAPVRRLGLVVIDEEHEQTYKQDDAPRYHARELAIARARLTGATVILGSATPSIESYYGATRGAVQLARLPDRVTGLPLPAVEIIDLRTMFNRRFRSGPLSDALQRALQQTVEAKQQAMLLLNRRGFARVAQCKTCGEVVRCAQCTVPLIYHASVQQLICHYCNIHEPPGDLCRACKKGYLRLRGTGTERIESELHRLFPVASIARMDRDTMNTRESHRELYDAFKSEQVGLLVGTQMIAKGFDFPEVTLVGIVSADTALTLPDFRAGERTFALLTQMAGRAGRGTQAGRVLIQTYCPSHYAIQAARRHDYQGFYQQEILMRRRLQLPPFAHLIELTVLGASKDRVNEAARQLADAIKKAAARRKVKLTLLGPAPHRIPRLRRTYRTCVIVKGPVAEPCVETLRDVLEPGRKYRGLPVIVDVDPL